MRQKLVIITFFLLAFCAFSEENLEIAEFEISDELLDTISIDLVLEETVEAPQRKTFAYITLSPRIGNDKMQKDYAAFLSRRANTLLRLVQQEASSTYYDSNWYQPAVASGVSFNLETGINHKIDERTTVNIGVGFSFDRMRAILGIENRQDSVEVLRATSLLVNNTASFSIGGSRSFDTSYFRIEGIEEAGVYYGAMFLFSRYFERDTIIAHSQFDDLEHSRRKNYNGVGAAGRIGLFARQRMGERSFFEYSIGYLIRVTSAFNELWEDRGSENTPVPQKISAISNGLELSFTLIF